MSENLFPLLRRLPLFECLADEDLVTLVRATRSVTSPKHSQILTYREKTAALYVVLSGTLKVWQPLPHCPPAVLNILGPDEVLGEMNLLDGHGHTANVMTVESCHLLQIERQALLDLCKQRDELRQALECLALRRFRLASERQAMLASCCLLRRVALLLLEFVGRYAAQDQSEMLIPLRLAQSDLSSLSGGTRYRTGECLQDLMDNRLIRLEARQHITIVDREALQEVGEDTRHINLRRHKHIVKPRFQPTSSSQNISPALSTAKAQ